MPSIEYPWPPACLSPNAKRRTHWRTYAKPAKVYRETCMWLTKTARLRVDPGLVPMTVTFHPPDRRRRDDDGMIGAWKHGRDGMADALLVDDRCFRPTYVVAEPIRGGSVVVTIEGLAE